MQGLAAGVVICGFDPVRRSWVTEAEAWSARDVVNLPVLDGTLSTSPGVCAAQADDFGHIVHRTPMAVLFPGSVLDIARMVLFARAHGLQVACRGKGHTAFGQSQVAAGISIDMSTLNVIHSLGADRADVDAGVVWRDLLLATTAVGLTPPVLTDFTGLTVGGTLSVGGVSGASHRWGAQVDNVLELTVVTGEGQILTCSPTLRPALFNAARAGLGLCAIIVRATLRLVPAGEQARTHRMFYADVPTMLADMRALALEGRFDHLRGNAVPTPEGWSYFLEGTSFHTLDDELPPSPFEGLHHLPGSQMTEDQSYFDFCDAVNRIVDLLKLFGLFELPHPWLDLFVPGSAIDAFAPPAIAALPPAELMPGSLVLFYPFHASALGSPLLRVPDEEVFFLFDILQTAPPDPAAVASALQRNRSLYDQNRSLGGTEYTISAVPLSRQDWHAHFGAAWGALAAAKAHWDPTNVLGGGLDVFG